MQTSPTMVDASRLMQLSMGFWAPKAFLSAVDLGVFEILTEGPADLATLVRRLSLHGRGARDFFDTLVSLGLLDRDEAGRYSNGAEAAAYLDPSKPGYLGNFFRMLEKRLWQPWGRLTEALRSGDPQNESHDAGGDPFEAMYADDERVRLFIQAMTAISAPQAEAIARIHAWSGHASVADIGTAEGGLLATLLEAHPHLAGVGYDLAPVARHFDAHMARRGLSRRARFQPGDFFAHPLPQVDALVMGHILHDWDLEQKKTLVRKAHDALPQDGAFLVYDMMIDDARRHNTAGLLMSLNMLIETPGGYDFTPAECAAWLHDAGFREVAFHELPAHHTLAIARK